MKQQFRRWKPAAALIVAGILASALVVPASAQGGNNDRESFHAEVEAACAEHAGDATVASLCSLYTDIDGLPGVQHRVGWSILFYVRTLDIEDSDRHQLILDACADHDDIDVMESLCDTYGTDAVPGWARYQIGSVILKLDSKIDNGVDIEALMAQQNSRNAGQAIANVDDDDKRKDSRWSDRDDDDRRRSHWGWDDDDRHRGDRDDDDRRRWGRD